VDFLETLQPIIDDFQSCRVNGLVGVRAPRSGARDEGGPLEAGLQEQASNYLKLLWLRARVVSVEEKAGQRPCQVRFRETSSSEPLMRYRKQLDDVKTGGRTLPQEKSRGNLFTAWVASGIKVA
jgi:hypothetical protein